MFGLASPFGIFRLIGGVITIAALGFGVYVALDEDLRALTWNKWNGDVAYEWPGGDRNITIKVGIEGKEKEIEIPTPR